MDILTWLSTYWQPILVGVLLGLILGWLLFLLPASGRARRYQAELTDVQNKWRVSEANAKAALEEAQNLQADLVTERLRAGGMEGQLAAWQAEVRAKPVAPVVVEPPTAQLDQLRAELEAAALARAQAEDQARASQADLADMERRLSGLQADLSAALPAALQAPAIDDSQISDPRQRRAARMGGLAAMVSAVTERLKQGDSQVEEVATRMAAAQTDMELSNSSVFALEADLNEKVLELEDLQSQVDRLQGKVEDLNAQIGQHGAETQVWQDKLNAARAAQAAAEAQVAARDRDLAEMNSHIDALGQRLRTFAPEGTIKASDVDAAGLIKTSGLDALVHGVVEDHEQSASSISELDSYAQTLQAQVEDLAQQKLDLESQLSMSNQRLLEYNDYSLSVQGQINEIAAAKTALEADLDQKSVLLAQSNEQLLTLQGQVNELASASAQAQSLQAQLDEMAHAKADLEAQLAAQASTDAEAAASDEDKDEGGLKLPEIRLPKIKLPGFGGKDKDADLPDADLPDVDRRAGEIDAMLPAVGMQLSQADLAQVDLDASGADRDVLLPPVDVDLPEVEADYQPAKLGIDLPATYKEVDLPPADLDVPTRQPATPIFDSLAKLPSLKTIAANAALAQGIEPVLSPCVQALSDVHGIGSVYQQRLYNCGIGTYWELAHTPDDELYRVMHVSGLQTRQVNFPAIRADALRWAEVSQTLGLLWDGDHVDDFESLPGIGPVYEKRLYEAGVTTLEKLATYTADQVAELVHAPDIQRPGLVKALQRTAQILAAR